MGRSNKTYNRPILLGNKNNCEAKFYSLASPFKRPLNFINELEFLCSQWQDFKLYIFVSDSNVYTELKENKIVENVFKEVSERYPVEPIFFNEEISDFYFLLNRNSLLYLKEKLKNISSELLIADTIFLTNKDNLVFYECINFYDGIWVESINLYCKLDIGIIKEHYCNYVNKIELIKEIKEYPFIKNLLEYSCI